MVSQIQWKPFWLATQLYPLDRVAKGVKNDVFAQAPFLTEFVPFVCVFFFSLRRFIVRNQTRVTWGVSACVQALTWKKIEKKKKKKLIDSWKRS